MLHLVDDIFLHLGFRSAEHAEKATSQIIAYCDYCNDCAYLKLFSLFQNRIDNNIPESTWVKKREDIAKGIRKLGGGYRQLLRDGWVRYLSQKNAAGGAGQSARQVETGKRRRG